jgi:hypothetical protein
MLEFAKKLACADARADTGGARVTGPKARPPTTARLSGRRGLSL